MIDDLQLSQIGAKKRKPVPPVPEFTTPKHSSKISPTDLFGPSDSESVSEADWAALNAHTSDSSESEVAPVEETYSEKGSGSEVASSSAEDSGSDYESGSSFEEAKRRQSKRSTRGSATSKQAAAGRKQQFNMNKARGFLCSPQSV